MSTRPPVTHPPGRSVGVEEEFFLVDDSLRPLPVASAVVAAALEDGVQHESVEAELYLEQVEASTDPTRDLADLRSHLVAARRRAARAAAVAGARLLAAPVPVLPEPAAAITPDDRYGRMVRHFGGVVGRAVVSGMHVHVEVDDADQAVRAVDGIAPWLPLVAAMSAGSPFYRGVDTGHASWRQHLWDAWATAGPTEPFVDAAGYRASIDALIASGVALDEGMVYLDARPSRSYPTVEVRVADVCVDVDDALLVAGVVRGLVTAAVEGVRPDGWRVELLRAARWRARRFGLSDDLLDAVTRRPVPAADALARLAEHLGPALERTGDLALVSAGVDRLVADGTGADRQRRIAGPGLDLAAVVSDLADRTAASYR